MPREKEKRSSTQRTADPATPITQTVRPEPGERILREEELVQLTGLRPRTIRKLEHDGKFPSRRKITTKSVGWLASEVFRWMRDRPPAVSNTGR